MIKKAETVEIGSQEYDTLKLGVHMMLLSGLRENTNYLSTLTDEMIEAFKNLFGRRYLRAVDEGIREQIRSEIRRRTMAAAHEEQSEN